MQASPNDRGWTQLFETAFTNSQNPMALTDNDRRIVQVNGALAQALGYRPSDLLGRHTYEFVVDGPLLSQEEWHMAIERGEFTGEVELRRADGDRLRAQFAVHPERGTGQRRVLFVALAVSRWGRHYRRRDSEATGELSRREREVATMVALGATSQEIASSLHISSNTARKHVNNAMRKVGARSRAHLVAKVLAEARSSAIDPP
jgi:PAS domain S-box-containing protein